MRYGIGAEYYKCFDKKKKDLNMWYAYTALGAIDQKRRTKGIIRYNPTNESDSLTNNVSDTRVFVTLGIGIIKPISKNLGFTLSAAYDVVYLGKDPEKEDDYFHDSMTYGFIIDFKAGIIALF